MSNKKAAENLCMTGSLFETLDRYRKSDFYPYHMPGHKRRAEGEFTDVINGFDITEIDGFDNLHQPEGLILEIQRRAAALYGSEESYLLVNGSTGGILSAVSASVKEGGKLLMARNCHRSVYHAAYLRRLRLSYLDPELDEYNMAEAVTPDQVREVLDAEEGIEAVLIVSPTYEGRIADVKKIAEIVHKRGIPLIVDEAHGAHLGFSEKFAHNSCQMGADLVINSVHKTLPALTQTALLHVNGSYVNRELLKRFLKIYQTSSPSYLFMASIDNALRIIQKDGEKKFDLFYERYLHMLRELKHCRYLEFPYQNLDQLRGRKAQKGSQDIGKLLISGKKCRISGKEIYTELRERFHLQLEMSVPDYCLAMFTVSDSKEAYERMTEACLILDSEIGKKRQQGEAEVENPAELTKNLIPASKKRDSIPLYEAWDMEKEEVPVEYAVGRYAAEFVNLYPPGVPYIVPGEIISQQDCTDTLEYISRGFNVQGVYKKTDLSDKIYMKVVRR